MGAKPSGTAAECAPLVRHGVPLLCADFEARYVVGASVGKGATSVCHVCTLKPRRGEVYDKPGLRLCCGWLGNWAAPTVRTESLPSSR